MGFSPFVLGQASYPEVSAHVKAGRVRVLVLGMSMLAACGPSRPPPAPAPPPPAAEAPATDPEDELSARIRGVVRALQPDLRRCYERGLARDAALAGRVVMVLEVDQSGRAAHVFEGKREGGFTDDDVKCFARVLKTARYHDGAGHPVRIQVPLAFTPASDAS